MKSSKTAIATLALTAVLSLSPSLWAQNTNAPGGGRVGGPRNVEGQMNRLTEQLTLTEDQKPKVKAILEEQNKKIGELRGDSASAPEDRRAKMQAIREETTKKMKEVLTAEQFKKYEEFQQQRMRRQGAGGNGGGQGQGNN
jgi:Spy/CpxP family protein refolding chaperone